MKNIMALPDIKSNDPTRERILDQAERLFATRGFEAVSIREITGAAESNLAAVNYHFGTKKNLYLAVFRERWVERTRRIRADFSRKLADNPQPTVPEVVKAMAGVFLEGPLNDEERRYHVQLMQRELSHPGKALEMVVAEVVRPYQNQLADLIRPNLPPAIEEERLRLCLLSILGMTIYFTFARPAVSMVIGREYSSEFKARLIEHITEFAVKGLGALKEEK